MQIGQLTSTVAEASGLAKKVEKKPAAKEPKSVVAQEAYLRKVFIMIEPVEEEAVRKKNIQTLLKRHEIISYDWCKTFSVPVYPQRYRSIEASRTYLRDAGLL